MSKIKMEVPYFQVPNDIFEIGLDKHELLVYMYLARCGNQGGTAFPSYNTIATKCSISRRKAIDCVKSLEEKNLLYKEKRYNQEIEENYSNIYVVNHDIKGSAQYALGGAHNTLGSAGDAPYKELDYKEINIKNIKGVTLNGDYTSYNYIDVLGYFLKEYSKVLGKQHPILTQKQWQDVIDSLGYVDTYMGQNDISEEEEKVMMKQYLLTDFKTEHNILHYISGDIRPLRFFECHY